MRPLTGPAQGDDDVLPAVSTATGRRVAIAAGHPLAVAAAQEVVEGGGNAVDAAVAAHAVCAVTMPDACGLGGDAVFLVRTPGGVVAVVGAGLSASRSGDQPVRDGGASVTVPGAVHAWQEVCARFGRVGLAAVLAPAVRVAMTGFVPSAALVAAVAAQRPRLLRGGAQTWEVTRARPGRAVVQPALAEVLASVARDGAAAFYDGPLAAAVADAVARDGGALSRDDLARHETLVAEPVRVAWDGGVASVAPPPTQGVLLGAALQWLEDHDVAPDLLEHVGVELTEAVFGLRDRCVRDGAGLLAETVDVDADRAAARRGGPRAYLHTTGVATAGDDGTAVSSLSSVFDDFGAGTFVPEGGFVLNNRGAGFTGGPNAPGPSRRPVHTLAPVVLERGGTVTALATPGADGQVQTLMQVLMQTRYAGADLAAAVTAPRWRTEDSAVLVGRRHPGRDRLAARGHVLTAVEDGDMRLGAVVAAVSAPDRAPVAVGDWRRDVATGGA